MNLDYAGGIFDGEGFVYIFKKVKRNHIGYYISVGVNMTHYPTIYAFWQEFGGHINNGSKRKKPTHRPLFMWGAANQKAAEFLKIIRPHILVKAKEVDVALKLQANIDLWKRTPFQVRDQVLAQREKLYQQCKELKTVSFAPLLKKGPSESSPIL